MQMITSILCSVRSAGILLALILISGCSSKEKGVATPPRAECSFRTGTLDASYCLVSVYRLITIPESFFDKPIYTVGYIEKGSDGSLGLAPSPYVFKAGDMASCVVVVDYVLGKNEPLDSFQAEGLYAVSVAGQFSEPVRGLCAGRLSRAVISNIRIIEEY